MSPVEILAAYGAIWTGLTIAGLVWVAWVYRDGDYPDPHEPEGELVDLDEWR